MKLLKRIKFALTYNIHPDFIVVPYGEPWGVVRFTKYEDAKAFAEKEAREKPMYLEPSILVIVSREV